MSNGNGKEQEAPRLKYSKELVSITPEMAQKWLDALNETNYRDPRIGLVREYAGLMARGEWAEGHPDGIQRDWFGRVGNGQHRLLAIVASQKTVKMFVETGIDPKFFDFSDKGAVRTAADDLVFAGFRRDVSTKRAFSIATRMLMGLLTKRPANLDAKRCAMEHEDVIAAVLLGLKRATPWRCEVAAAFCKATFEWPQEKVLIAAERYASKKFSGQPEDPLARLCEKVMGTRGKTAVKSSAVKSAALYAMAVSAIRAELEGRVLAHLYQTERDFLAPWQPGYVALERRESARKGHETMLNNIRAGDRVAEAAKTLVRARTAGMSFSLAPGQNGSHCAQEVEWTVPAKFPPSILALVNELRPEISAMLLEEAALDGRVQPAAASN